VGTGPSRSRTRRQVENYQRRIPRDGAAGNAYKIAVRLVLNQAAGRAARRTGDPKLSCRSARRRACPSASVLTDRVARYPRRGKEGINARRDRRHRACGCLVLSTVQLNGTVGFDRWNIRQLWANYKRDCNTWRGTECQGCRSLPAAGSGNTLNCVRRRQVEAADICVSENRHAGPGTRWSMRCALAARTTGAGPVEKSRSSIPAGARLSRERLRDGPVISHEHRCRADATAGAEQQYARAPQNVALNLCSSSRHSGRLGADIPGLRRGGGSPP